MNKTGKRLSWRSLGVLAGVAAVVLAGGLFIALRPPEAAPSTSPHPDLVLKGELTTRLPWGELPTTVSWNGTSAGEIAEDLQAVYRGQTLYKLVGLVDDADPESFNEALAKRGYKIRLVASDGYSADMDSKTIIGEEGWIVARLKNGEALPEAEGPYRDVGSFIKPLSGKLSVKSLVRIELVF
jgi:hypothetical protein